MNEGVEQSRGRNWRTDSQTFGGMPGGVSSFKTINGSSFFRSIQDGEESFADFLPRTSECPQRTATVGRGGRPFLVPAKPYTAAPMDTGPRRRLQLSRNVKFAPGFRAQ